jgi:hypothetical protein
MLIAVTLIILLSVSGMIYLCFYNVAQSQLFFLYDFITSLTTRKHAVYQVSTPVDNLFVSG